MPGRRDHQGELASQSGRQKAILVASIPIEKTGIAKDAPDLLW